MNTPPESVDAASIGGFRDRLQTLGIDIPVDETLDIGGTGPLWQPVRLGQYSAGNRLCIQPIEGWDADVNGLPSEATNARWEVLGRSGAKVLWTESLAVGADSRSSLKQLVIDDRNVVAIRALRDRLVAAHAHRFGRTDDLVVGVQLHHSGRLTVDADGRRTPASMHHHPLLDGKYSHHQHTDDLVSDEMLDSLPVPYATAAVAASDAGFQLIDVKACHGYLLHEALSAHTRPGPYGGGYENRTRLLRSIVSAVRRAAPDVALAVRLSAFDVAPPVRDDHGVTEGTTRPWSGPYPYTFGSSPDGSEVDLAEPVRLVQELVELGVDVINVSGASPYVSWHAQRPATAPNAGDYPSPEDPLVGVARHLAATAAISHAVPGTTVVGSAYSYLHQFFPHVAQAAIRHGLVDVAGYARLHLLAPTLAADLRTGSAALDPRPFW